MTQAIYFLIAVIVVAVFLVIKRLRKVEEAISRNRDTALLEDQAVSVANPVYPKQVILDAQSELIELSKKYYRRESEMKDFDKTEWKTDAFKKVLREMIEARVYHEYAVKCLQKMIETNILVSQGKLGIADVKHDDENPIDIALEISKLYEKDLKALAN